MKGVQHIHAKQTQQEGVQLEQAGCDRQVGRLVLVFDLFWQFFMSGVHHEKHLVGFTDRLRIRSVGAPIRRISLSETSSRQEAAAYGRYCEVFLAT